jgi:hypothetical protein
MKTTPTPDNDITLTVDRPMLRWDDYILFYGGLQVGAIEECEGGFNFRSTQARNGIGRTYHDKAVYTDPHAAKSACWAFVSKTLKLDQHEPSREKDLLHGYGEPCDARH